ncbi:hypothetical protein [Blastopirellula marina]|uniref:Uncharacterized protein n=1 Tax=Blastopirellula marina TaxID=124 RepID=A0A2S8G0R1_9BACT|nr:hypothetical protein [Blastopirellula marina]PQO38027.1 hypothetical protein C5Y98_08030 [Blastopirellula marina]PTL44683.1 hypothetical protein C5Y97_08030 [Blastopirellula marina]
MIHARVVLLIICLGSVWEASAAVAQEAATSQHKIGAHHQSLATCVSLLLDDKVHSEALLDSEDSTAWVQARRLPSYQTMNQRAIRLRSCSIYLYQPGPSLPDDSLWRERLSSHGVRLVEVTGDTTNAGLLTLADELCRLFPGKRETIAENLSRELERRGRSNGQVDLAQLRSR